MQYAILANPGHNRIYFETSLNIAHLELEAILSEQGAEKIEILELESGLPAAICFQTNAPLSPAQLSRLGAASIYYALFEIVEGGLLKPLKPEPFNTFPDGMNQILKYTGKTNEQFTRLMVNLALSACRSNSERKTLLDPMCGKGTTLFEGLIQGLDVVGVDINDKWIQEIKVFIIKYLKNGRFKHSSKTEKRVEAAKKLADCFVVETAANKEDFGTKYKQTFKVMAADTRIAGKVVKKNSCDIIVSDLPYGVQHGSKQAKQTKMERSPLELLDDALPSWNSALKKGAAIVLSFNEFTLRYTALKQIFIEHGFTVMDEAPYYGYLHKVDQSIKRNLIVAVKS